MNTIERTDDLKQIIKYFGEPYATRESAVIFGKQIIRKAGEMINIYTDNCNHYWCIVVEGLSPTNSFKINELYSRLIDYLNDDILHYVETVE